MKKLAKILFLIIAVALVCSSMFIYVSAAEDSSYTTVYLAPNAKWAQGNARFAVYCQNDSENEWVDMHAVLGAPGMYYALIPEQYTNVTFCSMNPDNPDNSWEGDNLINFATSTLAMPSDGATLYTVAEGAGYFGAGTWSSYIPVAKIGTRCFGTLQAAIDAATTGNVVIDVTRTELTEDVVVARSNELYLTINGNGAKFNGSITIDGKSAQFPNGSLTIKNVAFDATNITKDACINFGGTNAMRYVTNVTVDGCTFTGVNQKKVAIKSYTAGDKNIAVLNCTVDNTMHSLLQAHGVNVLTVDNCVVNSKNGINLNESTNVEVKNSTINVNGYALRAGQSSAGTSAPVITLTENTIHTNGTENDPAIILRGTVSNAQLTMTDNAVTTENNMPHIAVTNMADSSNVSISADANYWGGAEAPTYTGIKVDVTTSYPTADRNQLVYGGNVFAHIDDVPYFSVEDALSAAVDGDTVKLFRDIEGVITITRQPNLNITVDGDGHTFNGSFIIDG